MNNIKSYFPHLTIDQQNQFDKLGDLYSSWNEKINVVSRKDIDNIYEHHILHSLAIAKLLTFANGTSIIDVGTGGGFPGIPLAIMFPECKFHLIDRIGKKLKVAEDVASNIGLKNVTFQHGDISENKIKYDFVVSRAVMPLNDLIKLVRKNISQEQHNGMPNGVICLKGGDLTQELKAVSSSKIEYNISEWFNEDFFSTKKCVYVQI